MVRKIYVFEVLPTGDYLFSYGGKPLLTFSDSTFRSTFEAYALDSGFSSNWVGSMLRLFRKNFSLPSPVVERTSLDRLVYKIGVLGIVEHLKSRGYRVSRSLDVSDSDLIRYLEKEGFEVEGVSGDVSFSSDFVDEKGSRCICG